MALDLLPDVALIPIFSQCSLEDISSLQRTNRKLFDHITNYRPCYSKITVESLEVKAKKDGQYEVVVIQKDEKQIVKTIPNASLRNVLGMFDPLWFISVDNIHLQNMSRVWLNDRRIFILYSVIDYRRYLPYFDRCKIISLTSYSWINLTEILSSMETKTLHWLSLSGIIECTDEDIRKIGRLSQKLDLLELNNVSKKSKISNDAILDLIETGSFVQKINIKISRIEDFKNMEKCLANRTWVSNFSRPKPNKLYLQNRDGFQFWITTDEEEK